jgi:hypothetical protein
MDFLRFPLHAADGTSAARCKDRNLGTSCRQLAIAHYINFSHLGKAPGMPAYGPGGVKTLRGITALGILRLVITLGAKQLQKFILRSLLRPSQISFSHSLAHRRPSPVTRHVLNRRKQTYEH